MFITSTEMGDVHIVTSVSPPEQLTIISTSQSADGAGWGLTTSKH